MIGRVHLLLLPGLLVACDAVPGAGPMTEAYAVVQDGTVVKVRPVPATPALPVVESPAAESAGTGCPQGAAPLYGGSRYCLREGAGS